MTVVVVAVVIEQAVAMDTAAYSHHSGWHCITHVRLQPVSAEAAHILDKTSGLVVYYIMALRLTEHIFIEKALFYDF